MSNVSGKTALVTGAGRGIGQAVARRLAQDGAVVAVNDLVEDRAETASREIMETTEGEAFPAPGDVSDFDATKSMFDRVEDESGPVEILVNNAGLNTMGWFLEEDPDEWPNLLKVNLLGQIHCARVAAERMVETETEGTIIGITSDAGRNGAMAQAVYSSTKAGIIGFTKSLARELSRYNITANAVAPGPVETEGVEELQEDNELAGSIMDGIEQHVPLGRLVTPEDVAGTVAFLAGEDAEYITGQVISVSGGLTMND